MSLESAPSTLQPPVGRVSRAVWHTIGLVMAALLAYLIWRGYQSPDFLLDLSALRFC